MNHWSAIQHDVNIFCSCVTRIQDRNQSGCSVDDKVHIFLQTNYVSFMPSFHNFKFMCTFVYEIYRLQVHVHCSRKKTRSTGTLP
jgi:hypothetical protein